MSQSAQIKQVGHVRTRVHFRALDEVEIQRYIDTGSPFDKAGAYGIQDYSGIFVDRIEGCFYNVVGLPISRIYHELEDLIQKYQLPASLLD